MKKNYNKEDIERAIKSNIIGKEIIFFEELGSTNDYLKENCFESSEGTVVIARSQTKGRGRRGNQWENSIGDNIFMSVLLKPNVKIETLLRISLVCSLSILKALKFSRLDISIKWPNDVIINGKKVCGILPEFVKNGNENNLILGIGVNVKNKEFKGELEAKATSLYIEGIEREVPFIISNILKQLEQDYYTYLQSGFSYFIDEYKKNCININKEVVIIFEDRREEGRIIDINSDGSLLFRSKSGEIKSVMSNEVSVRGVNGYL